MMHRLKKRFGQHFLVDQAVIQRMVAALNPQPLDFLVEIGPGAGALTDVILPRVNELHVIELDRDLIPLLNKKSEENAHKLHVHQADILQVDFSSWAPNRLLRVVGNLPYNISTPLLFHLLQYINQIQDITVMLQKEVADRITAEPNSKTYGRLSVMMQYYCEAIPLFDVDRSAFSPPPRVQSSVIALKPRVERTLARNEKLFAGLVNQGFQMRRKTLRNALRRSVEDVFWQGCSIASTRRAETLSVAEWVQLSNEMCNTLNQI